MISNGFNRSMASPCLYMKKETNGSPIILVLYVDDMLIAGKHETTLQEVKYKFKSAFPMKDLGKAEHILGKRIRRDRQEVTICVPRKVHWEGIGKISDDWCKAIFSASSITRKAFKSTLSQRQRGNRKTAGYFVCFSLWVINVCNGINITWYCICNSSKQIYASTWIKHVVKSILRYLKGTKGKCICYRKGDLNLHGYCDSDMAGDVDTRKSTYSYIYTVKGGAIFVVFTWQQFFALYYRSWVYLPQLMHVPQLLVSGRRWFKRGRWHWWVVQDCRLSHPSNEILPIPHDAHTRQKMNPMLMLFKPLCILCKWGHHHSVEELGNKSCKAPPSPCQSQESQSGGE